MGSDRLSFFRYLVGTIGFALFLIINVTVAQDGKGYTTAATIIKNADLVGDKEIARLAKLEKLDLSNFWNYDGKNTCDSLQNLSALSNLKELNLAWTKIKSLPVEFSNLKNLEVLNISFNDFGSFPVIIDQLPNLKLLIISHVEFDRQTMSKLKKQTKKYKIQIDYF